MKRALMLAGVLIAAPAWCDETGTEPAPPTMPTAEKSEKASLALESPDVRKTLRDAARQLTSEAGPEKSIRETPSDELPATKVAASFRLQPPLRQPVVVECRVFECLGYDATGKVVGTVPPPERFGYLNTNDPDDWYSCQSRNNMLSTFERLDECSGIRASTSFFAR